MSFAQQLRCGSIQLLVIVLQQLWQLLSSKDLQLKLQTILGWAVVVAQLVEWLLPTPEIPGLNPVIGNNVIYQLYS